jgi:hypothetical protein
VGVVPHQLQNPKKAKASPPLLKNPAVDLPKNPVGRRNQKNSLEAISSLNPKTDF